MIDYYSNKEYVSNSMLGWLYKSPRNYQTKLQGITKYSPAMELGQMVHMSILEPEKFIVAKCDKPSNKMGELVDIFLSTPIDETKDEYEHFLIAHADSGFKQKSDTVYKKFMHEDVQEYITERRENEDRIFLDAKTKYTVTMCSESVLGLDGINELLDTGENRYEEVEIYWIDRQKIKRKSKIDKLIVNIEKNIAYNIDVKTTSTDVYNLPVETGIKSDDPRQSLYLRGFMASYISYGYHRQQAFYEEAIKAFCKDQYNIKDIEVQHMIIAVETKAPYDAAVYRISDKWVEIGRVEVKKLLSDFKWHQETGYWKYPKDLKNDFIIDI